MKKIIYYIHINEAQKLPPAFCAAHFSQRFADSARFRFARERLQSIGAGALLWFCFGDVEETLLTGEYGKPYLPESAVQFNLSHSGDYAILATGEGALGADIEKCSEKNLPVARKVFTPAEQAWLQTSPVERFEQLWTLKESVMKALGKGLQLDPASFEVLDMIEGKPVTVENVKLYSFTTRHDGYCISLCGEKELKSLQLREITAEMLLEKDEKQG
ncbi:MAG: 4'-phosphopantetheinyl transferase superfamily protein [Clostridia bacterium]|nr:4'-phosphopantetheinyl transferase superfamily protein [Clostridia bacterium]